MVDDARRAELERLAEMPEEAQDQYLIDNVPASERREFIADMQQVAAEDEGLFGRMAERVTTFLTAGGRADRLSQQAIKDASSGEVEYVQGTECPNTNYPAISHEELKRWSETDNEPGTAGELSGGYESVRSAFEQANEALSSALKTTSSAWEGEAAKSATQFVSGLSKYSESTTNNAKLAAEVTNQQSQSSSMFRNAMPEPIPFSWQSEMDRAKSAGPLDAISIMMNAQTKQAESHAAHDRAAEVANSFEQQTFASSTKTPVFAEPPKFSTGGGGDSGSTGSSGGVISGGGGTPRVGGGSAGTAPSSAGGGSSPSGSSGAPSVNAPGGSGSGSGGGSGLPPGAVRLPDGSIRMPDGTIVKPDGTKVLPDGTVVKPDGTRILPDGTVIPPGNTTAAGLASGSSLDSAMGAGFAPVGGGAGGAGGAAGGFGPLGGSAGAGGAGAGGAGAGGLGAGKGSGVGGFGPTGSGAAGAKGAFGGGMGRGGMGGMMGGAGAGGAKGDDEKEHKDQFYVKQEMDPGLHVEHDEYGEKLIDEQTGFTVVPPVIGE